MIKYTYGLSLLFTYASSPPYKSPGWWHWEASRRMTLWGSAALNESSTSPESSSFLPLFLLSFLCSCFQPFFVPWNETHRVDIVKSDFLISLSAVRHPAVYVEKLVNSYLCIYVSPPLTICKRPRHDFTVTGFK